MKNKSKKQKNKAIPNNQKKDKKQTINNKQIIDKKQIADKKQTTIIIISFLKKIFTVKVLALIASILAVVIAIQTLNYNKNKDKKEENRIQEELERKYLEELDNTYENLFLAFQCIPAMKKEYNADIIIPNSTHGIIQSVNIFNKGRKTAKNTELTMCIKGDVKFGLIHTGSVTEEANDTIYQDNLAKWEYKGVKPNMGVMPVYLIMRNDGYIFQNGQTFSMCYTLSCEDKARPVELDVNYRVYLCNSLSEYLKIIKSNNDNDVEYFNNKDFVIFHYNNSEGSGTHLYYYIEKTNNSYTLRECPLE